MAPERSPAFMFYPADFLADAGVRILPAAGRGVLITLMAVCWRELVLPTDDAALAKLAEVSPKEWARVRDRVLRNFVRGPDGYRHPRLDDERAVQAAHRTERSDSGKRGAARRWGMAQPSPGDGSAIPASDGSAIVLPMAKHGSSSSSSSSFSSSSSEVPPSPPEGESAPSAPDEAPMKGLPSPSQALAEAFVDLWNAYPKKHAKADALKVWRSLKPDADLRRRILDAVTARATTPDWTKDAGKWVPLLATFLRGRRWEDEVTVEAPSPARASAAPLPTYAEGACQHDPPCNSPEWHAVQVRLEREAEGVA